MLGGVTKLASIFSTNNASIVGCVARFWSGPLDVGVTAETGVDGSRGYDGSGIVVEDSGDTGGNTDGCSCVDVGFSLSVVAAAFTSISIK